jgi:hypothetical protein
VGFSGQAVTLRNGPVLPRPKLTVQIGQSFEAFSAPGSGPLVTTYSKFVLNSRLANRSYIDSGPKAGGAMRRREAAS